MHLALMLVVLVGVVTAVGALARRFGLPAPLILTLFGAVASFLPFVPQVELTADLVLVGLLPPLLYAAAIRTSLIDFRRNLRPIGLLSVGLVVFTALGVGLVVWLTLPVSPAVALALGAVVAPPDAVAATTVARRVGLPRRVITILEGESLVNDATALVCLRTALAAAAGALSVWGAVGGLALSVGGGVAVGVLVAVVVGKLRKHIDDPLTDTSVSLITPFVAYLLAEEIHASGVLALVVTGLILGHMSPRLQSASSRIFMRTNWATIQFVLENLVFLLIGLQVEQIVTGLGRSTLSGGRITAAAVAVLVAVIVLRFVWVFPSTYLPRMIPSVATRDPAPSWKTPVVISWAGMRGVVTLAAVFVLPPVRYREVLVLIALVVVGGTLLLQGSTLPWLVRRLGLSGPDPREDSLAEAETYQRAATAGLQRLDELVDEDDPEDVIARLRTRSLDRANAVWERLGSVDETPSQAYARLRIEMLQAEREEVLQVRRMGGVPHEVIERVLASLDIEETVLDRVSQEDLEERAEELQATTHVRSGCEHLRSVAQVPEPSTPEGCEECLAEGLRWVHLRLCLDCGHVGCCDSSVGRHASLHFAERRHPVIRSFETGEAWRWCFVDEVLG